MVIAQFGVVFMLGMCAGLVLALILDVRLLKTGHIIRRVDLLRNGFVVRNTADYQVALSQPGADVIVVVDIEQPFRWAAKAK